MSYSFVDSLQAGSAWNWFRAYKQDQHGTGLELTSRISMELV
jgi:hypothetical protein